MKRAVLIVLLLTAAPAFAAPVITGGPVNAASYALNGLPDSGIAQGGIFILFGTGLGPGQLRQVSAFPIPTQLGGTSVSVTVGTTTVNCLMLYTLDRQVAAILPSTTPAGDGSVQVTFNNETSNGAPIRVVRHAFGVFSRNQAGSGPSIIQNFNSQTDQPTNSILEAATPGQFEIVWGTGLGPVSGDEAGGALPGDLVDLPIEIFVGDQPATVTYRGRSGCCAGVDQVVFTVPEGVRGCYVSVAVVIGGIMSNRTTMAIAPERGPCSDPIHMTSADIEQIQRGGSLNIADFEFVHWAAKVAIAGQGTIEANAEFAEAGFGRLSVDNFLASKGIEGFPSLGSCVLNQFRYKSFFDSIFTTENPIQMQGIDAGPALTVSGPRGAKQMTKSSGESLGFYEATLGGVNADDPMAPPMPDFLVPGNYTINNGNGGAGIGAFNTQMNLPGMIAWTNRDSLPSPIARNQPLSLTWSGADGATEFVFIIGSSANPAAGSGASFVCTTDAGSGSFTVPSRVLSAIPASGPSREGPVGFLMVGKAPLRSGSSPTIPNVQLVHQYCLLGSMTNTSYQ